MKKRINHNNLLPWFTDDHGTLPASYLASCEKFFDSICWPQYYGGTNTKGKIYKLQATSGKQDLTSSKLSGNSRIIKENKK
jgi:hypothetical protein